MNAAKEAVLIIARKDGITSAGYLNDGELALGLGVDYPEEGTLSDELVSGRVYLTCGSEAKSFHVEHKGLSESMTKEEAREFIEDQKRLLKEILEWTKKVLEDTWEIESTFPL